MSRRVLVVVIAVAGYFGTSVMKGQLRMASPLSPLTRPQAASQREVASDQSGAAVKPVLPTTAPVSAEPPFAFEREFQTFSELHAKVLLTEDEQAVKKALLEHVSFLRGVGQRLLLGDTSVARERENGLAIDLLFEALNGSESREAADILQGVVADASIESGSLSAEGRRKLAGIKAEVLYKWSSRSPGMGSEIEGWLPGPVSRQIWANVARLQSSNEAESQLERAAVTR